MLTLFHTAHVHKATFDVLRDRIAPDTALDHKVRTDWLTRAQDGIGDALRNEITDAVRAAPGRVVCTCTSIGMIAADAGAIRIDQPMMNEAARLANSKSGAILMVYCLKSTLEPSVALLDDALAQLNHPAKVHTLSLAEFWPLFEAGQSTAFTSVIAAAVRNAVGDVPNLTCVVLAQASMASAATMLDDLEVPVLASPEMALRAALAD